MRTSGAVAPAPMSCTKRPMKASSRCSSIAGVTAMANSSSRLTPGRLARVRQAAVNSPSSELDRDLLEDVQALLRAALHAGGDDRVADLLAVHAREHVEPRAAMVEVLERAGDDGGAGLRRTLEDLRVDQLLVRDDLVVLAVEGDLEAALGDHRVAPPA